MGEGVRSWMRDCSDCGAHYRITNWSYRWVNEQTLEPMPWWLKSRTGYMRVDVHQLKHLKLRLATDQAPTAR